MNNKKCVCFYFVNTTDIQEYTGLIIECIRANLFVHIMIFDITSEKRNFYYYTVDDFENYFDRLSSINYLTKNYSIKKYTQKDQLKFLKDYNNINPDLIFTRLIENLKYAYWIPIFDKSKTVMFLCEPQEVCRKYENLLSVSRYSMQGRSDKYIDRDIAFVNDNSVFYSGMLRYAGKNHKPCLDEDVLDFCKNKKTCFIPETWARNLKDKNNNLLLILEVIKSLKSMGYHIAYKMREKGYPAQAENSKNYIREVEPLVDLMITKDLSYPSSLYYLMNYCDLTCIFNVTTTILDAINLSKNPFVFLSKHLSDRYRSKLMNNNPLSWGRPFLYENLEKTVNLYDEKYNTILVRDFLLKYENENKKKDSWSFILSDDPHKDLVDKILHMIDC